MCMLDNAAIKNEKKKEYKYIIDTVVTVGLSVLYFVMHVKNFIETRKQ